uniref:Uncharacterized protein n=1 Tax=Meloidogyne enterolobii TaxID=390850 RepID=A0A6V7XI25_MELEN|nr:unnamed protein product [Meloidogyne enterolobii]
MPDTLELDSSWTVALSNIIYPFSFSLAGDSEEQESITVFRRYGNELLPIRIEIPDLSFASEEALEEAINAVLLDVWKKELDREREEQRLEENKKRIYGNFRKRRAVESIKEQYDKHGYFDLDAAELNKFIKLLSEEDEAISPKLTNLSPGEGSKNIRLLPPANQKSLYLKVIDKFILSKQPLEPAEQLAKNGYFDMQKQTSFNFMKYLGKKGIRLPPISPAPLAVDGIERVRFSPYTDQLERIKQAINKFMNPSRFGQTEEKVVSVSSQEITPESTPQTEDEHENPQVDFSLETITQQLQKEGYFDMPKDLAYKFIKYLNTEIKGAKLPNVSTVVGSSDEMVRLEPQTDQKDLIMNAIKSFVSPSPAEPEPIEQPETTASVPSEEESLVENDKENSNEIEETPATEVTSPIIEAPLTPETPVTSPIIEAPPTPVTPVTSPIIEAPPTPVTSPIIESPPTHETPVTSPLNEENQIESNDNTPLDGKITPLTYVEEPDEKPLLTDDQKVLMEMAVRAATRAWRNSVELAEQAQINMELGEKYWQNARFKYALKDSVITLKETGEIVHLRKTPENILEWVKSQLILLTNRKIAIYNWTQECLEYGKRASEAQLETKAAESRGDVSEARKAADRAKAAERKVKEAASQVEEAVAGQKRLSEEIIGKVDAELAKQEDTLSIPVSPTIEDENEKFTEENIEENIDEHDDNEALIEDYEEEWTPPLPEENIEENIEANEEPTIIEEGTAEEDTQEDTQHESQTITDDDEEQWEAPLPEESNEVHEETIEDTEEDDTREEPPQESQTINDEDEEQWTPPLPEEKNIEENIEANDEPTIIEEETDEENTQEETLQESQTIYDKDEQWAPPLAEEDPVSIPPSTANLLENIVPPKVDEIIHTEERPSLPRPEMLIGEPPHHPSSWKSFFGLGGVSSEDKTKNKELPGQKEKEEPHKEKLTIRVDDSDPNVKKMHFAKYDYPPEYLKMLLSFSNIQLADPKYQWVSVHFDKLHKRFHVFLQGNVQYIQISRQLAYTLGFDSEKVHSGQVAKYMPDISGGVRQFLVYAPRLVENSIIGNVTAPLLRVVNLTGKPGDSISEVYMTEHQHRILGKRHPDITIEIRTLAGKLVKFHWGTCILTLHFQRSLF